MAEQRGDVLSAETVERIRRVDGGKYVVLSVYLNLDPDRRELRAVSARLKDLLKPIEAHATPQELGHDAAMSLRADVARVFELEERIKVDLGHGVAVFGCHGIGFSEYVSLPRKVWDKAVADATVYVRPLLAVLDQFHRTLAVVVDRRRSQLFEFYMGELEAIDMPESPTTSERDQGSWRGLSRYGRSQKAEELAKRFYKETAELVRNLAEARRCQLLVVGGHHETVEHFLPHLPNELAQRVAGTFVADHPDQVTHADVRDHCARLEEAYERRQQEQLVAQLLETKAAGGLAEVGLRRVLDAANLHAIDLLVVHGGATVPGVVCDHCGWLGEDGERCLVDGTELRRTDDVIDELTEATIDESGSVEQVLARTPLAEHLVGARLRFPVADLHHQPGA